MKEEGSVGGLGSDLDLDPNPDPWKILWIRMQHLWIRAHICNAAVESNSRRSVPYAVLSCFIIGDNFLAASFYYPQLKRHSADIEVP